MEIVFAYLQQGVSAVVPFVILLGLLVFVHEFGHFAVAKFFGVRVEVFSLGFGKKLLQYKKGDTNYCISIIPLGGYVKMYGDDPTAEISEESKKYSFLHKPVGPRIGIVLAGPLMNFVFAIFLFMLVGMMGEDKRQPVLGDITPNTVAYSAGLRSGDRILQVSNTPIQTWEQFQDIIEDSANISLNIKVERDQATTQEIQIKPELQNNPNPLSLRDKVGSIDGLNFKSESCVVGISRPESPAAQAGIKSMDEITAINGKTIKYWRDLQPALQKGLEKDGNLDFTIVRTNPTNEKSETVNIHLTYQQQIPESADIKTVLGIENPELFVTQIVDNSPAQTAGLLPGDKLVRLNNKEVNSWEEVVGIVSKYTENEPPIEVIVVRNGETKTFHITPKITSQLTPQGQEIHNPAIGIIRFARFAAPDIITVKTLNPLTAFWHGVEKTWDISVMTIVSVVRLIQNKISTKTIGGFIAIGQAASQTFQIGITHFLQMMAVISINLFILNLLPIPILDGGHLVFFTIEALKGSPLSLRKMEIAQQLGLVLLLALLALSLFNDFSRIFSTTW